MYSYDDLRAGSVPTLPFHGAIEDRDRLSRFGWYAEKRVNFCTDEVDGIGLTVLSLFFFTVTHKRHKAGEAVVDVFSLDGVTLSTPDVPEPRLTEPEPGKSFEPDTDTAEA